MKKNFFMILAVITLLAVVLGCKQNDPMPSPNPSPNPQPPSPTVIQTYTVTFDKNASDATGSMESQIFTEGEAQNLSENVFVRSGYKFLGWSKSSTGSKVYNDKQSISITEDTTLYALWQELPLIVYKGSMKISATNATVTLTFYRQSGKTKRVVMSVEPERQKPSITELIYDGQPVPRLVDDVENIITMVNTTIKLKGVVKATSGQRTMELFGVNKDGTETKMLDLEEVSN